MRYLAESSVKQLVKSMLYLMAESVT